MVKTQSTWIERDNAAERKRLLIERELLAKRVKAEKAYGQAVSDEAYAALQATCDLAEIYGIACDHDIDIWTTKGLRLLHALSKNHRTSAYFVRQMTELRNLVAGRST